MVKLAPQAYIHFFKICIWIAEQSNKAVVLPIFFDDEKDNLTMLCVYPFVLLRSFVDVTKGMQCQLEKSLARFFVRNIDIDG